MTWLLWLLLLLCLLAFVAVGISAYGAVSWAKATRTLSDRLEAARIDRKDSLRPKVRYDPREIEGLPAPVQRYFRAALEEGQPIVTAATLFLDGRFNMSGTAEKWKPFKARQRVVTRGPGFLWDARIAMLPGLTVRVVDTYIAGKGMLLAAVLGVFKVADIRGGGEIARGEFMRYFAEAAWYPTALLPSQGVRWEAVDDLSANATIADGPLTLTLLFRFSDAGLITGARAEARGAMVGKTVVMMPWEGTWSDYQVHDGMKVPMRGEAAWLRPEGRKTYFVGTVRSITYEFSR